jgi:hypothetical protein
MFDLRPLEGAFIVFAGPCLVDSFGRTSLAWASLGHEAHRLDTMAHTLEMMMVSLWRFERHLRGPILALHHPNDFPLEARVLHLGA